MKSTAETSSIVLYEAGTNCNKLQLGRGCERLMPALGNFIYISLQREEIFSHGSPVGKSSQIDSWLRQKDYVSILHFVKVKKNSSMYRNSDFHGFSALCGIAGWWWQSFLSLFVTQSDFCINKTFPTAQQPVCAVLYCHTQSCCGIKGGVCVGRCLCV